MKIFRIAAMFQTFGLEEKLTSSFKRHYNNLLSKMEDAQARRHLIKEFRKDREVYIGSANLSDLMPPIIAQYGNPKVVFPKRINFHIIHPSHSLSQKTSAVAYLLYGGGEYSILKVSDNLYDIDLGYDFEKTIAHETQHFLKSLYDVSEVKVPDSAVGEIDRYYGNEWEIQSYAMNIARDAIDNIRSVFDPVLENKDIDKVNRIKSNMKRDKDNLTKSFLFRVVNNFFNVIEEKVGGSFSPDLRKKYYQASFRDFGKMFDSLFV